MSFLFKNRAMKSGSEKLQNNDPLPGFLKMEPSFNTDYTHQERENFVAQPPQFPQFSQIPQPQPGFSGPSSQAGYSSPIQERQAPVTLRLSHAGLMGALFALLLLGVLFFLAGFLSGMLVTEYATQPQSNSSFKENQAPLVDAGDENV